MMSLPIARGDVLFEPAVAGGRSSLRGGGRKVRTPQGGKSRARERPGMPRTIFCGKESATENIPLRGAQVSRSKGEKAG